MLVNLMPFNDSEISNYKLEPDAVKVIELQFI